MKGIRVEAGPDGMTVGGQDFTPPEGGRLWLGPNAERPGYLLVMVFTKENTIARSDEVPAPSAEP